MKSNKTKEGNARKKYYYQYQQAAITQGPEEVAWLRWCRGLNRSLDINLPPLLKAVLNIAQCRFTKCPSETAKPSQILFCEITRETAEADHMASQFMMSSDFPPLFQKRCVQKKKMEEKIAMKWKYLLICGSKLLLFLLFVFWRWQPTLEPQ